jgi:hypothetical protein
MIGGPVIKMKLRRGHIMLCAWLLAAASADAQSSQPGFGVGPIHEGLVVGAIAGIAAVAAIGITFLVLHNRGVVVGCVAESGGKRTLVASDRTIYELSDGGGALRVGDRVKVKGHKSGSASSRLLRVDKVLKDYGHCQP